MNLGLMYYLITIVSSLEVFLTFLCFVGVAVFTTLSLMLAANYKKHSEDDDFKRILKGLKKSTAPLIILLLLNVIIPSKKDMIIISGLHLGQQGASKVLEETSEFYPLLKKVIKQELTAITDDSEEDSSK